MEKNYPIPPGICKKCCKRMHEQGGLVSVFCSHTSTGAFISSIIPDASWTAFSPITPEMFSAAVVVMVMAIKQAAPAGPKQ